MVDFRSPDDSPPLPLWDVVRTAHVVARAFRQVFAEAGLTPQQFGVLASLADEPGCTRAQLARNVLVRPQSVARLIDTLLADGLLEQEGPRGRGRPARLSITEQGWARLRRAWPGVVALNSQAATGLAETDARRLSDDLIALRERLDA